MGDVEDPQIFAGEPLWNWQQTEQGKWCMQNASDLTWHTGLDPARLGYTVTVVGKLTEKDFTYHQLKWGK